MSKNRKLQKTGGFGYVLLPLTVYCCLSLNTHSVEIRSNAENCTIFSYLPGKQSIPLSREAACLLKASRHTSITSENDLRSRSQKAPEMSGQARGEPTLPWTWRRGQTLLGLHCVRRSQLSFGSRCVDSH